MSAEAIYTYLKNGSLDYNYGLSLLRDVCNKKMLIQNLSRKESTANHDKITYELEKYLDEIGYEYEISVDVSVISDPVIKPAAGFEINSKNINAQIKKNAKSIAADHDSAIFRAIEDLKKKKRELYGIRDHLHPQLKLESDEDKRMDIALRIYEIQPKLDELQAQIELIQQTGHLPTIIAAKQMSGDEYKSFIQTKSYIRRYKALVAAATTIHDKERYQALLDKHENKLKTL